MQKRNRIIYWIATIWLCLGMVSTAIVQFMKVEEQIQSIIKLGYPLYFLNILATWKIAGVIAILIPKLPVLKEWAYAGFVFAMSGAAISHMIIGDGFGETFPSILLLLLTITSWYFRPADRKPSIV
ncbi:MAG: DoxX family protein [Flavitalea sp.]